MNDLNICFMCGTKENLQQYGIAFKCEDCYMKGLEEKRMGICMDCKKSKCDCMQNHWELVNKEKLFSKPLVNPLKKFKPKDDGCLKVCEEEKMVKPLKEYIITTLEEGNVSLVKMGDYLKVVEELENQKEISNQLYLYNGKKENDELQKQLVTMTNLCNERGKRVKELEKEIEGMKTLKVCMKCQVSERETIDKYLSKGRYQFVDNCLQEDCEMCEGEDKNKFVEVIEQTNYGFKDSWMLSYKIEGMKDPIVQHHLTKEECEIIYGNMNNITYWFMELMKND